MLCLWKFGASSVCCYVGTAASKPACVSLTLVKYNVSVSACCSVSVQVYQQLLQAGADTSIQDADGKTAAQLAPKDWAC